MDDIANATVLAHVFHKEILIVIVVDKISLVFEREQMNGGLLYIILHFTHEY